MIRSVPPEEHEPQRRRALVRRKGTGSIPAAAQKYGQQVEHPRTQPALDSPVEILVRTADHQPGAVERDPARAGAIVIDQQFLPAERQPRAVTQHERFGPRGELAGDPVAPVGGEAHGLALAAPARDRDRNRLAVGRDPQRHPPRGCVAPDSHRHLAPFERQPVLAHGS